MQTISNFFTTSYRIGKYLVIVAVAVLSLEGLASFTGAHDWYNEQYVGVIKGVRTGELKVQIPLSDKKITMTAFKGTEEPYSGSESFYGCAPVVENNGVLKFADLEGMAIEETPDMRYIPRYAIKQYASNSAQSPAVVNLKEKDSEPEPDSGDFNFADYNK